MCYPWLCYRLNGVPPPPEKTYVEVLISSTCECIIWKQGLSKFNQDIGGPYSFKTSLLIRREAGTETHNRMSREDRGRVEVMGL